MTRLLPGSFLALISESIALLTNSGTEMTPHSGCDSMRLSISLQSFLSIFRVTRSSFEVIQSGHWIEG